MINAKLVFENKELILTREGRGRNQSFTISENTSERQVSIRLSKPQIEVLKVTLKQLTKGKANE